MKKNKKDYFFDALNIICRSNIDLVKNYNISVGHFRKIKSEAKEPSALLKNEIKKMMFDYYKELGKCLEKIK